MFNIHMFMADGIRECFLNYVGSKVMKRMDNFKVRSTPKDKQRRVLVPLSLGTSSVALLHLLDQQLSIQKERTSRVGYEVHVLHVEDFPASTDTAMSKTLCSLSGKYPLRSFTTAPLDHVYRYSTTLDEDDLVASDGLSAHPSPPRSEASSERLSAFLTSLPSPTSRLDMVNVLRTRLIVRFAKAIACESIAWGDSTTRLAEKTLAETAMGRGFSIPWQTADGKSPHGIHFIFPMRDLLRKEIVMYSELTTPPLTTLIIEPSHTQPGCASSKDMTIDELMNQYFGSVEQNYPSIVANVVRTSGRLQAPSSIPSPLCRICCLPVASGTEGLHRWGGDQEITVDSARVDALDHADRDILCYGCSRSMSGSRAIETVET